MVDTNSTGCYSNDVEFNATKKGGIENAECYSFKRKNQRKWNDS